MQKFKIQRRKMQAAEETEGITGRKVRRRRMNRRRSRTKVIAMMCMACILTGFRVLAADQTLVGISMESGTMDTYVDQMSREEKVGQMLLVSPSQLSSQEDWTVNVDEVLQNMKNYYVGGLIFFAEDLTDPDAVKLLIDRANEQARIPVLTVMNADGSLKSGYTKPSEDAGLEFGPVSADTEGVWCYSTRQTPAEEWKVRGILLDAAPGLSQETGTDFVIVTHAKVKYSADSQTGGVEDTAADDGRPASMARSLVTGILRPAFEGVVMTDSLSMPEVTEGYGGNTAVMNALQAGADILTAPSDVLTAYYGIHSAIDEQMVAEDQINASVARILEFKRKLIPDFVP